MPRLAPLLILLAAMASAQVPQVNDVLNAGGDGLGIAPGALVFITGSNLAKPDSDCLSSGPWPDTLCSVQVTVSDKPCPLNFTNPGVLVCQIPFDIPLGQAGFVVDYQGRRSAAFPIELVPFAPAILSINQGEGFGRFFRDRILIKPFAEAMPGEIITMFLTGLGATQPAVPAGQPGPLEGPALTLERPLVRVGDQMARVHFSAASPGRVADYRIAFEVPAGLSNGNQPVTVESGGVLSNTASLIVSSAKQGAPVLSAETLTNSASFVSGATTPGSWADLWGENYSQKTIVLPDLPDWWEGTSASITDHQGRNRNVRLHLVSPNRLQFYVPDDLAPGPASLRVSNPDFLHNVASITVPRVAPGVFSAAASGEGPAAATWLRVTAAGARTEGFTADSSQANVPIKLGGEGDQVFLSFFGTGFRNHSSTLCTIGGENVPVYGAVAHPGFVGLDQAVVGPVPSSLAGRGEVAVQLNFDGILANPVTVSFR